MSFERPAASRESFSNEYETFQDLREQTGVVIQWAQLSDGRITVQALRYESADSQTPETPIRLEKTFTQEDKEQSKEFYKEVIETLKSESSRTEDRDEVFESLTNKISG